MLVTARYRAGDTDASSWLAALGWQKRAARAMELQPLTRESLGDVLVKMGAPLDHLGTRIDIVRRTVPAEPRRSFAGEVIRR